MNTTINIYLMRERLNFVLLFYFQGKNERRKIIVNNKELEFMSLVHYNRNTYR